MHGRILLSALTAALLITLGMPTLAQQDTEPQTRMLPSELGSQIVADAPPQPLEQVVGPQTIEGYEGTLDPYYIEHQPHGDWLITYHRGEVESPEFGRATISLARLYWRDEQGYTIKARWQSVLGAYLQQPEFYTMIMNGEVYKLLWVPAGFAGTGNHRLDTVYHLDRRGVVRPVAFEPAPYGYMRLSRAAAAGAVLNEGEGIWKGEGTTIRPFAEGGQGYEMCFTFFIWNDGDGNCCPSAGQVNGTYTLRETDQGPRIEIDTFERNEIER